MQIERPGGYFYPSAVLHGAALHECGCVLMIFVTKLIQDKNSWKKPIFFLSVLSFACGLASNLLYMFSLDYLMFPRDGIAGQLYYARVLKSLAVVPGATSLLMEIPKSPKFLVMAALGLTYCCLFAYSSYLGIRTFEENIYFYLASTYKTWQLVQAVALFIHIAVVLGGTMLFLLHIANSLSMSGLVLLREMATKHEAFLTLYLFLESSYSAAKDIVKTHGMTKSHVSQVSHTGAKQLQSTRSSNHAESIQT
ncbi:hypothetical protein EDD86DRAFT_247458 [Gorgonomyces haynaldii]|nr:hypothetical protein EDD86DRAFT_247458 [Gorgonomyces haynaldii]